jgi:hypothetical protein
VYKSSIGQRAQRTRCGRFLLQQPSNTPESLAQAASRGDLLTEKRVSNHGSHRRTAHTSGCIIDVRHVSHPSEGRVSSNIRDQWSVQESSQGRLNLCAAADRIPSPPCRPIKRLIGSCDWLSRTDRRLVGSKGLIQNQVIFQLDVRQRLARFGIPEIEIGGRFAVPTFSYPFGTNLNVFFHSDRRISASRKPLIIDYQQSRSTLGRRLLPIID